MKLLKTALYKLKFGAGCRFGENIKICKGAQINTRYRKLLTPLSLDANNKTTIGDNVYVGQNAIVQQGAQIGSGTVIDSNCIVEQDSVIGSNSLITYSATVCSEARIGDNCIIGGFVGERTIIGDFSRVFGNIVHSHRELSGGWDDDSSEEAAVTIGRNCFVGFGATVAGGIIIGDYAYICCNSIVTKDVEPNTKVSACGQSSRHNKLMDPN